ncbi:MAG: isomerizing glutamine--fructose-6-phosphate transaminase, partial [Clostridia bacterium]|nr:isomerizing glutamine--fructose-6-phosphate transaminase [Clostridia bacterium]
MCGIVGYVGTKNSVPYLVEGLSKLEYRGYDSAGIAVFENGKLNVTKRSGRLSVLEDALKAKKGLESTVGIGHTRWATHGAPTDENAHPHLSENGLFAVVHNGIIENYAELKKSLSESGVRFSSQTDTEVIAAMLEKNYEGDFLSSVLKTFSLLEGTYALAILCRDFPDSLVLARKSSPLVLGKGEDGWFAASDVTAVLKHTSDVYKLSDGELAVVGKEKISFMTFDGKKIEKEPEHITWSAQDAQKDGYAHFMLKEIFEQPAVFERTISPHIRNGKIEFENFSLSQEEVKGIDRIIITACGSAYHAGIIG